jgi:hypothetical protein
MDSFKAFAMGEVVVVGLMAAHLRSAVLRVGVIPQLGIVFDDLRLGLREGRSSTELRWPPAKKRVSAVRVRAQ